jgi:FkbH-like protein
VFIDDSSFECSLVQELLPEVLTLQVPERIYEFPDILRKEDPFFALAITDEDRLKTEMYQAEHVRQALKNEALDLESYLASLEISARVFQMTDAEVARVAQLTQKTNQFNLTTRRYDEAQIRELSLAPDVFVHALETSDRFGQMGLTLVSIGKLTSNHKLIIDTFLMSCRVFERGLEGYFLQEIIKDIEKKHRIQCIAAEYIPTKKNGVAASFWEKCGMTAESPNPETGAVRYTAIPADLSYGRISHIQKREKES